MLYSMLYRAYNNCCNWYSFTKEIEFLRDLFRQNGYPGVTFENCVKGLLTQNSFPAKNKHSMRESVNSLLHSLDTIHSICSQIETII